MNDLISRQQAINKFKPWLEVKGYSWGELNMLRAVINELENMPSVQQEIIQCKDCKFSDEFDGGVWLCRRRKKSCRVLAIDTCKFAERRTDG